jgi:hypothetical protein
MVRIKHRYLLINVLYPDQEVSNKPSNPNKSTTINKKPTASLSSTQNKSSQNKTNDPDSLPWTVQFRRPSADSFNAKLLAKLIRDGVEELFGEYGAGMVAASFQGELFSSSILLFFREIGEGVGIERWVEERETGTQMREREGGEGGGLKMIPSRARME